MGDATDEFWEGLARRGHEPVLEMTTGTLRVDLVSDGRIDHWFVRINRGDVAVSKENSDADCVVRLDRATANRIARGEMHSFVALMRGAVAIEGNPELILLLQRLFPAARQPAQHPGIRHEGPPP